HYRASSISYHFVSTFFFYCYGDHRDLHSFPTRRSSDLGRMPKGQRRSRRASWRCRQYGLERLPQEEHGLPDACFDCSERLAQTRSEEHTSELQSRFDLVCRLLLEKKKKKYR